MQLTILAEEFKFNCECRRLSEKTTANYSKQIMYLVRYLKEDHQIETVEDVTAHHIRSFLMQKQKDGRKPAYINDLLKAFKVFFGYAKEEEYVKTSPTEKVKNVKQPKVIIRTFDKSEIKRMLSCYLGADFISIRNQTILVTFFDTGIRLSELIGLSDDAIHDDHLLVHGKGDKERVVPKSPVLAKHLLKYIRTRDAYFEGNRAIESLFVSRYGKSLSKTMIERIIKDAGIHAQVKDDIRVSPHTIRHCFAQQQLKNGLDLYSLSRIMGHENIAITQRYLEGMRDTEILKSARSTSTLMNL